MRGCFKIIMTILNMFLAIGLIVSAYSGLVNPDKMPLAGVLALTFVIWLCLAILALVADLIVCRKLAWIQVVALCVCYGPIHTFCPINIRKTLTPEEHKRSFTVMNYNVEGFYDDQAVNKNIPNRTVQFIIDTDADIVCLQECDNFSPREEYGLGQEQIDSLLRLYPYHELSPGSQVLLSKYPFIRIDLPVTEFDHGVAYGYTLAVDGRTLTIFNVHLQSLSLTDDDRRLYVNLTRKISENRLKQAKTQLISKLCYSFQQRAIQARTIKGYIDTIGGNVIVCGDFNDIPNCYAIRTLEEAGMHDAYAEAGLGPSITYHTDRFYFRIDHSLYRGHLEAVRCERGNVSSSDHYPLTTTYLWN